MKKPGAAPQSLPAQSTLTQRLGALPSLSALDPVAAQHIRQQLLQSRAQALAEENQSPELAGAKIEVLEFVLADEHYAVETAWVREVYPLKSLTPLPCVPPFVMGIVPIRGRLVSVIDLKRFLGLPEKGLTDLNKIVVLQDAAMEFAVLADRVIGVHEIFSAELQASAAALSDARLEYLKGVTAERLIVLDGWLLLHDARMVVNQEVTQHPGLHQE
jgi:purine-binding chemotaxis protein CheW